MSSTWCLSCLLADSSKQEHECSGLTYVRDGDTIVRARLCTCPCVQAVTL